MDIKSFNSGKVVAVANLDLPIGRLLIGGGLLEGDLEYDLLLFGPGGGLFRFGEGDLENDLDRDRFGGYGDVLLGGGENDLDLDRFLTAPAASFFLLSFSRIIRSNSFSGSSIVLQLHDDTHCHFNT